MTTKIETSEEVRVLNRVIELADELTDYRFDTLSAPQLIEVLRESGRSYWQRAATQIEQILTTVNTVKQ